MDYPHLIVYELIYSDENSCVSLWKRTHYISGPKRKDNNHKRRVSGDALKIWDELVKSGDCEITEQHISNGKMKKVASMVWEG